MGGYQNTSSVGKFGQNERKKMNYILTYNTLFIHFGTDIQNYCSFPLIYLIRPHNGESFPWSLKYQGFNIKQYLGTIQQFYSHSDNSILLGTNFMAILEY